MNAIDLFLLHYGLLAIFIVMLAKSIGVPIPIPADLIVLTTAAGAVAGKFVWWQALGILLLGLVLGGIAQYILARGPGRSLLYRLGRSIGLTQPRLDAAATRVKQGGIPAISVAILVPGVRGAAIVASGLASVPLRVFLPGLIIGSSIFLCLHFFLAYAGGSALLILAHLAPLSTGIPIIILLLVVAFGLWVVAARRQKAARAESEGEVTGVWHEGVCPVCLALYTANRLRPLTIGAEQQF